MTQRIFRYNSIELEDPGPQYDPVDVRNLYSATYPEITSAAIEGPDKDGDKVVYTFRRAVGTKGSKEVAHINGYAPKAAGDVLFERKRQIEAEGWTPQHDDAHDPGELACAGASYALHAGCVLSPHDGVGFDYAPPMWPTNWAEWWKPKDPRSNLVRAAALIIAEIERMDRETARAAK